MVFNLFKNRLHFSVHFITSFKFQSFNTNITILTGRLGPLVDVIISIVLVTTVQDVSVKSTCLAVRGGRVVERSSNDTLAWRKSRLSMV